MLPIVANFPIGRGCGRKVRFQVRKIRNATVSHEHSAADRCSNGAPSPEVLAAEERVREAREELRIAEEHAESLRRETEEERQSPPSTSIGAVVDDVLTIVKKYPIPSIVTAASVGFFLGRLFRR